MKVSKPWENILNFFSDMLAYSPYQISYALLQLIENISHFNSDLRNISGS